MGTSAPEKTESGSVARVVPSIPSFSVDDGFRYAVPPRIADSIRVGSMVRVPLGGRRVGGYIVSVGPGDTSGLKEIASVSGRSPVFDAAMLDVLRWAAAYYLAPLSVMLGRTAPPNVPPGPPGDVDLDAIPHTDRHPVAEAIGRRIADAASRTVVVIEGGDPARWIAPAAAAVCREGSSMMVVMPTSEEVGAVGTSLKSFGNRLVVVGGDQDDAAVTAAWRRAAHVGGLVIGTPRIAAWRVAGLAVVAAVEESRRAMKDRQTPTVAVRDLLRVRAQTSGLNLIYGGPTPSLEVMARGPETLERTGRVWPLVEVVDRREEPPGSGLLSERVKQAIRAMVGAGGTVFLFAHRRGYSAASRCVSCRTLRRCAECGSRPDPGEHCRRCGARLGPCGSCGGDRFEPLGAGVGRIIEEVGRVVGRERVAEHPTESAVTVGTERDLPTLDPRDLIVMVDIDGLIYGINYRAGEESLRIAARLASALRSGSGRRLMVQTHDSSHPVITALRRGDPRPFIEHELAARAELGYPPSGQLLVIEIRGGELQDPDGDLASVAGAAMVLGPADVPHGRRWLVQGANLTAFKAAVRPVIQRWRDSGATVRVDVDPIDL